MKFFQVYCHAQTQCQLTVRCKDRWQSREWSAWYCQYWTDRAIQTSWDIQVKLSYWPSYFQDYLLKHYSVTQTNQPSLFPLPSHQPFFKKFHSKLGILEMKFAPAWKCHRNNRLVLVETPQINSQLATARELPAPFVLLVSPSYRKYGSDFLNRWLRTVRFTLHASHGRVPPSVYVVDSKGHTVACGFCIHT